MKITDLQSWLIEIPQRPPIAPYQSRYRAQSSKESVIFRVETDTGVVGWGETPQSWIEGKPFDGSEGRQMLERLRGWDPFDLERLYIESELDGGYLQSGVEMALWDIMGKATGRPLYQLLGGAVRSKDIELAACMGIQPYDRAGELAKLYVEMGFTTLKTKAGRDPQEDLTMVRGVRDAVGDRLKLRIDPNQGYDPQVAFELARDLEPFCLEYLEQPVPRYEIAAAAEIRRRTSTPVGLNESVTTLDMVLEIIGQGAADVLLPDTYQCAGVLGVKKVAVLAEAAAIPCVMHCSHDLGPKTAAMLHIVVSSPIFTLANDCTYYGLVDDVITSPFQIERGHMRVPESPGLGVEVSPAKLDQYRKR
ncbi:MAG: mandelate racemase/muconate lactonizing enzyme family protein [Planctomycetes bacterium]|nr:mandelate racemase/muconate lactonizing enzyme family protein [Planctomycetota bacterium]